MFVDDDEPSLTRVLGIDPGLSRCGYGLVERTSAGMRAVVAGVVRTPTDQGVPERLRELSDDLELLFAEHQPHAVAVERVLFQVNARTAMSVGQASGLVLVLAARRGVPVTEYSPNEVKLAVAGHGGADKEQVGAMVRSLLKLDEPPRPADTADALALALCHLTAGATRRRLGEATGPAPGLQAAIASAVAREEAR